MVTKPEVIQLYSNARVFCCLPFYEPFGIINLEAMACHAPVVASATGGIKEVVVDNETGFLVPFEQDPATSFPIHPDKFAQDLAARMTDLLGDEAKCKGFGEAGRKRVEDIFSWTAIADPNNTALSPSNRQELKNMDKPPVDGRQRVNY